MLADALLHGFVLDDGVFLTIEHPDSEHTFPTAISDNGIIVGYHGPFDQSGGGAASPIRGVRLERGAFTPIAFGGDVVGGYFDGQDGTIHGYVLSRGIYTTVDFPGGAQTQIRSINERGDIVGGYFTGTGETRGFIGRLRHGQ